MLEGDGFWVRFGLLRSWDWLNSQGGGKIGDRLRFDMPEMGVVGEAQLMQIDRCPEIIPSSGRLMTGWFEHSAGKLWQLEIEGMEEPIRGTGKHPIYSVDRQEWVPLSALKEGECVQVRGGLARARGITETDFEERVYNIEVEGDHCYRVGERGVLVHNASAPDLTGDCSNISSFSNDNSTPSMFPSPVGHGIPEYTTGKVQGVLVANGQEARLISGQTNPGLWLNQAGIQTAQSWYHVEGHAVSIMRQCCIMEATLHINKIPCDRPPASCQTTIQRALLPGYVLHIIYENADHMTTGRGYFDSTGWHPN